MTEIQPQAITDWGNSTFFSFFSCVWHFISHVTFSWHDGYDLQRKYRILTDHLNKIWPGFNDQQTNSDDLKYLHFCLKVSSCYPAIISELMESLVYCRLKNSSIIPGFGNKDSIQLTFISSCCLEFGTIVGQFWKVLVIFEIASHLTSYHLFSPANFSQCTHEWLFFCTLNISLILTIYDIGHQYAEPQGILMKWPLM